MDKDIFFTELETLMKEMGYPTLRMKVEGPEIGETLRALMPVDDMGNNVLLEVMIVVYNQHTMLIQIYTTMITEIGPGYEALKEMALQWNLTCRIGAFGIYPPKKQFYHKYNYLLSSDEEPKDMAEEIFYIIHLVMDVITEIFPEAVRISASL